MEWEGNQMAFCTVCMLVNAHFFKYNTAVRIPRITVSEFYRGGKKMPFFSYCDQFEVFLRKHFKIILYICMLYELATEKSSTPSQESEDLQK